MAATSGPTIIGRGAYSTVFKEIWQGEEVAVKCLPLGAKTANEVDMLQRVCDLPQVVKVLSVQETPSHVRLIMPCIPRTLLDLVEGQSVGIPMQRLNVILDQLIRVVHAIHSRGIVHKDIKLENILYKDGQIYLCDFGFARFYTPGKRTLQDNVGSMHYSSPEIWNSLAYEGPEVDVWAMGVCVFLLATSYFPFGGTQPREVYKQIETRTLWFPPSAKSRRFRDMVSRMLAYDPAERITVAELADHAFLMAFKNRFDERMALAPGATFSTSWDTQAMPVPVTDDAPAASSDAKLHVSHSTAGDPTCLTIKSPGTKSDRTELAPYADTDPKKRTGLFNLKFLPRTAKGDRR